MIADNIIIFLILFVLSYCFSDSFLAEIIIIVLALMNIDWSSQTVTTFVTAQETWLFGVIALYGLANIIQWLDDTHHNKPVKSDED